MYGMSAFRLAGELGIARSRATEFLDAYTATYAGVQRYFADTIMEAEKTGYVETLFGRRRELPDIRSGNKTVKAGAERVARNTPIQGTAADIVKKAMIAVDKEGLGAKMLLQVHDELIFECPREEATENAEHIKQIMENVVKLKIPLKVSVETGERWGDFH
jgi:DNA polymerase-1